MKLIFVRHGEPLKYEYGISKMGIDELELLGEYLKENFNVSKIFSATSQRATESADVLNKKFNYNIEYYQWLSEFKYRITKTSKKQLLNLGEEVLSDDEIKVSPKEIDSVLEKLDKEENERERAESDESEFEDREEREYWESEEYWDDEGIEKEVY